MSAAYIHVHFRLDFLWKRFQAKIMYPDQTRKQSDLGSVVCNIDYQIISCQQKTTKVVTSGKMVKIITVKAPNIAHLSLLTSVGYNNKKETKLEKCTRQIK